MTSTELVPVNVADLPVQITRVIDQQTMPEPLVRAALAQAWPKAFKEEGFAAIAAALVICAERNWNPLNGYVYVAKFDGSYQAFPSHKGYLADANRSGLFDGAVVQRRWEDDTHTYCEVAAYRKDRTHPAVAVGFKPHKITRGGNLVADPHKERKAYSHALRLAVGELFEGYLPPLTPAQAAYDHDNDEDLDGGSPALPPAAPLNDPPSTQTTNTEQVPATRKQLNHLFALSGELGYDDETRKSEAARVLDLFTLESFNDLLGRQADKLIGVWTAEVEERRVAADIDAAPEEDPIL